MELTLQRITPNKEYSIGRLYIDGNYFCDTLEDKDRHLSGEMSLEEIKKIKIKGKTAIPIGRYEVTLNVVSPKFSNYSRYSWSKEIKGRVPRLLNVKGFEGILIHPGNDSEDTDGCILPGKNSIVGKVLNSIATFRELYNVLKACNDKIWITIKN